MAGCSLFDSYRDSLYTIFSFSESDDEILRGILELAQNDPNLLTDEQAQYYFANAVLSLVQDPNISNMLLWRGGSLVFDFGSINDITIWLKNALNQKSESSEDETSKLDNLDKDTEAESLQHYRSLFITETYGGESAARNEMLNAFTSLARGLFFVNPDPKRSGYIRTQDDFDTAIDYSINKLYQEFVQSAKKAGLNGATNLPKTLIAQNQKTTKQHWEEVMKFVSANSFLTTMRSFGINNLYLQASEGNNVAIQARLQAFQKFFILSHFDQLLVSQYGKAFEINEAFGIMTGSKVKNISKYLRVQDKTNGATSWGDDTEQTDAIAETSDQVKLFWNGTMIRRRPNSKRLSSTTLRQTNTQEVALLWSSIMAKFSTNNTPLQNLGEAKDTYLTQAEYNKLIHYDKVNDLTTPKTLKELYTMAADDIEAIRLIFKVLAYTNEKHSIVPKGILNDIQLDLAYSIYKEVFDDEESALRKAYLNSERDLNLANPEPNYYEWFTNFFGGLSHIHMTQYSVTENGTVVNRDASEPGIDTNVYNFRTSIGAAFSASTEASSSGGDEIVAVKKFKENHKLVRKSFTLDWKGLEKEKLDDKFITVNIGNSNLLVLKQDSNRTISISTDGGKVFTKLANTTLDDLTIEKLNDFCIDILGLRGYDKNILFTELKNNGLSTNSLVKLSMDVLYNFGVSAELLGVNRTEQAYLAEAGKYYHGDLKLRMDGKDLISILDTNTGDLVTLCHVIDAITGRVREAVVKSADGTNVNTISTAQLAASAPIQWELGKALGENYICSSFESLFGSYDSVDFARDTKTLDSNKRTSEFTEAEHFAYSFVGDYLSPMYAIQNDKIPPIIRILPLIISDKTRLLHVRINLNGQAKVPDGNGGYIIKTWKEATFDDIKAIAKNELGGYYQKMYNELGRRFSVLSAQIKVPGEQEVSLNTFGNKTATNDVNYLLKNLQGKGFDFISGFTAINEVLNNFRNEKRAELFTETVTEDKLVVTTFNPKLFDRKSDLFHYTKDYVVEIARNSELNAADILKDLTSGLNPELNENFKDYLNDRILTRSIDAVTNLFHELVYRARINTGETISLPANSAIVIDKKGNLVINAMLIDQLYRWDKMDATTAQKLLGNIPLSSGEGNADQFFRTKELQVLSDILQDNCEITLKNRYRKISEGPLSRLETQTFGDNISKVAGYNLVLGTIQYQWWDSNGEIKTFSERLTNKQNFKRSFILKQAFEYLKYSDYENIADVDTFDTAADWFESPNFDFRVFEIAATKALEFNARLRTNKSLLNSYYDKKAKSIEERIATDVRNYEERQNAKIVKLTEQQNELAKDSRDYLIIADKIRAIKNNIIEYKQLKQEALISQLEKNAESKAENIDAISKNLTKAKIKDFSVKVIVNPDIAKFNALNFLFGQEYTIATVGTHLNHPGMKDVFKSGKIVAGEALDFCQQTKRNVTMSATKNKYHLDRLNGLSSKHKTCIISNEKDEVYNLTGTKQKVFNDDGACYTVGIAHYWENASLGSNAVGLNKKTFFHDYDAKLGTGYIGKDAGFTGTNAIIRSSNKFYEALNFRALGDFDGELTKYLINGGLDITKKNGNPGLPIEFPNFAYKYILSKDPSGKEVEEMNLKYFTVDGKLVTIPEKSIIEVSGESIKFDNGFIVFNARINGTPQTLKVQLKNVHDIWKFFGGAYSGKVVKGDITSNDYDDSSTELTANLCNWIGEIIDPDSPVLSQKQVNQFLKKSVVVYFPTVESVKQGAANVNDSKLIWDFKYKYNTNILDLHDSGVQLNAEHHADDTVISMMTQVLSALGAKGFTAEEANSVYQALRSLTQIHLKSYIDAVTGSDTEDSKRLNLENFITKIIGKTITSGVSTNNEGTLAEALMYQAKKAIEDKSRTLDYDTLRALLPLDDEGLLRSEMAQISSALVKSCIKVKFPGSMDVLSPSNGRFLLYDGRMEDSYEGDKSKLLDKDKDPELFLTSVHEVELGRTYRLSMAEGLDLSVLQDFIAGNINDDGTVDFKVNTPEDYWMLKRFIKVHPGVKLHEVFSVGRDLGAYNIHFKDTDGNFYNLWDIKVINDLYRTSRNDKNKLQELQDVLQNMLNAISSDPNFTQVTVVDCLGVERNITIDKASVEVIPYEIIMAMHDQSQFGLRVGDEVKTIVEDKLFFLKRELEQGESAVNDKYFDIELKAINKDANVWLAFDDGTPVSDEYFTLRPQNVFSDDNGNYWQVDAQGRKIRKLASDSDKIYMGANGETLIVTKTPEFYVDSISHVGLTVSTRVSKKSPDVLKTLFSEHLIQSEDKNLQIFMRQFVEEFNKRVQSDEEEDDNDIQEVTSEEITKVLTDTDAETLSDVLSKFIEVGRQAYLDSLTYVKKIINSNDTDENKLLTLTGKVNGKYKVRNSRVRRLIASTLETHTSFLKSLEVLAARIPAQCMQSFMAMKIVGFDKSGVNTSYVSRFQIYLQGSDFDIDKVSLLGFKFRNGRFVTWSQLMDISSKENLEASLSIPFPTGVSYKSFTDTAGKSFLGNELVQGVTYRKSNLGYEYLNADGEILFTLEANKNLDAAYEALPTRAQVLEDFENEELDTDSFLDKYKGLLETEEVTRLAARRGVKKRDAIKKSINSAIRLAEAKHNSRIISSVTIIPGEAFIKNQQVTQRVLASVIEAGQFVSFSGDTVRQVLEGYGFDIENSTLAKKTGNNMSLAQDVLNFIEEHKDLFKEKDGKYVLNVGRYKTEISKAQLIKDLAKFITAVNSMQGLPKFNDNDLTPEQQKYNNSIEDILKEINKHNTQLNKNSRNLQDALINFVSSTMYNVSKNPNNQIQAQNSVDSEEGYVKKIKDLASNLDYSKRLARFNPGAITSLIRMMALTLGGKKNTGICASSLKTFEALAQYTYNVLNEGSPEEMRKLVSSTLRIAGKEVHTIANPYQQNKQNFMPIEVIEALNNVSATDAYLLISAFLSLSTDNAKDPTLPKINAGDKMIALYLAGIVVGCDIESLIPIMTSKAGLALKALVDSNIFTGKSGQLDITEAIRYIEDATNGLKDLGPDVLNTIVRIYNETNPDNIIGNDAKPKAPIYWDSLKASQQKELAEFVNRKTLKELKDELKKLKEKINANNAESSSIYYAKKADVDALEDYISLRESVMYEFIEINGEQLNTFSEIKKLNSVLQEIRIFSQIGRLNQDLPNTIQDKLVWKDKFELAIDKRIKSLSMYEKSKPEVANAIQRLNKLNEEQVNKSKNKSKQMKNLHRIDFVRFVEDEEYRKEIIDIYDALKVIVNPYAAMANLPHYFGYMQTLAGNLRVNEASNIYKNVEHMTKYIVNLAGDDVKKQRTVGAMVDWVSNNLTAKFLRDNIGILQIQPQAGESLKIYTKYADSLNMRADIIDTHGKPITIALGTDAGNQTFKVLMEEFVIPALQSHPTLSHNPLVQALTFTKFNKTQDRNTIIKMALRTSALPRSDFEKNKLTEYKAGLDQLSSVTSPYLPGLSLVDALFIYNLIVNGGKQTQTSLTSVFANYAMSQGKTDSESGYSSSLIAAYYDSRRINSEKLTESLDFSEEEAELIKMSVAPIDGGFKTKAEYIYVKDAETRDYVLLHKLSKADALNSEDSDLRDEASDDIEVEGISEEASRHGYEVVGIRNNLKVMQSMLIQPEEVNIKDRLFIHKTTGEVRLINSAGKKVGFSDLFKKMTPEARIKLNATRAIESMPGKTREEKLAALKQEINALSNDLPIDDNELQEMLSNSANITDMKSLLLQFGFITVDSAGNVNATSTLEGLTPDALIDYLTTKQC